MLMHPPPTRRMTEERRRRALDRWLARWGLLMALGCSTAIVILIILQLAGLMR